MDPSQTPRGRAAPLEAPGRAAGGGPTVRFDVVEGDATFARALARALEARGIAARLLLGGRAALDAIARGRPDLVVLCAELPDGSGYALCGRLRRDERTAAIPIVVTSARAGDAACEAHRRLRVRADAYLGKPFDAAALLEIAAMLVDVPPAPGAPRAADRDRGTGAGSSSQGEVLEDGFVCLDGAEPEGG